jgi:hypothetical protein
MRSHLLLRPGPHPLRPIQLLLLLVALTGALGRDRLSGAGALCAQHMDMAPAEASDAGASAAPASEGRSAHSRAAAMTHGASSLRASGHECTHCPPSECATTVPCAAGPSGQSARAAVPALMPPPMYAVRLAMPAQHALSAEQQPPTPPPQLAS